MKKIINALKTYQQIHKMISGDFCKEVEQFIHYLKPYEKLSIEDFFQQLSKQETNPKKPNKKPNIKILGKCYYNYLYSNHEMTEELKAFLEMNQKERFTQALTTHLEEAYSIIEQIDLRKLKVDQLKFLGYALLDEELRGKNKVEQRKYLLQNLWKVIETQKMNEIYERAL